MKEEEKDPVNRSQVCAGGEKNKEVDGKVRGAWLVICISHMGRIAWKGRPEFRGVGGALGIGVSGPFYICNYWSWGGKTALGRCIAWIQVSVVESCPHYQIGENQAS